MSAQTIGNDGLTDAERIALAERYERIAATMTPEQVRDTTARIKVRRKKP